MNVIKKNGQTFINTFMEIEKNMIFTILQPATVESTSCMQLMRKQGVQVIDQHNVDVHHTAADYSQLDFFDG